MHLYFVTLDEDAQKSFLSHFETFIRKCSPKRFEFAFDPEGKNKIYDYRILWRPSSIESVGVEVGISVINLSEKNAAFHFFLDRPLEGLFYVVHSGFGELYSDIAQMRLILPDRLLRREGLVQGGLYFRDDVGEYLPEDLKAVSTALRLPLYVEKPNNVPNVCSHIINRICQVVSERKGTNILKDQADLPI